MISSHAGEYKWEHIQNYTLRLFMNTKWDDRTYRLENFTCLHQISFIALQEASDHVNFQIPTAHSRVGFLVDNTPKNDPDIWDAISSVYINTSGIRNDFENIPPSHFLCVPILSTRLPIIPIPLTIKYIR